MIQADEDALICDLAETYNIYDYRQLPPTRVAVFACGLRDCSRIKMKLSGQKVPLDTLLLAGMSDRLSLLTWFQTADGQKGKNRPAMLVDMLTGKTPEKSKDVIVFDSGEDFESMRKRLIGQGRGENGN
jgi:hypothetical protein